jgi:uncharacterized peroxidase-related enzyme
VFIDSVPGGAAEGSLADFYEQQRAAWGFLPNFAGAFSTRPEVGQAWTQLNGAIRGGMDRRQYEIASIAAARELRNTYCTAAHSMFLRDVCHDEATLLTISGDPSGETLPEQDQAVYQFATKVARDAASVEQADVDRLRQLGLSETDVANVVFAVAARSFFTRVLDGLGAQLDVETAAKFPADLLESMLVGRRPAALAEPAETLAPNA